MRKKVTQEERVANNIGELVSDLRIDLEEVGKYVVRNVGRMGYNRLVVITESAKAEQENSYVGTINHIIQ